MVAFFLDHIVSLRLAEFLRPRGHTARTAREMRLESVGDEQILLTAATHEWIVVTHNVKDFRILHDTWLLWSGAWDVQPTHHGILIIPDYHQWLPERAAEEMDAFAARGVSLSNALYDM